MIKQTIRINVMAFIEGIQDTALAMYNGKNGKIISVGKTESYIKIRGEKNTLFEFIPNINLKPFGKLSV